LLCRAAFVLLVAVSPCVWLCGCGGKLAPLGDAGLGADGAGPDAAAPDDGGAADSGYVDGALVVTRVVPSSGPNSGGATVSVYGAGFVTDGGTQITFAGFRAADASCSSDTECVAVTPYPGPSDAVQVVHVQATIHGVLGDPGSLSSEARSEDVYTYLGGPACSGVLTCEGPYFPKVVVTCPTTVNFYVDPRTGSEMFVATGTSYTAQTDDLGGLIAACDGTPTDGSCTAFSTYEPVETYCGAPGFCQICEKWGGTCGGGQYPTCTF
jgi:hypothetical protein